MSWLEIGTLAVLPAFLLLDLLFPAPKSSRSRWWRTRATAVTAVSFWLSLTLGQLYGQWFGDFHLLDGSVLGTAGGAIVGVLAYEFCHYWYHRSAHRFGAQLRVGIVWINSWMLRDLRTPFGGTGHSGLGREGGLEAMRFFTEPRNVGIALPPFPHKAPHEKAT